MELSWHCWLHCASATWFSGWYAVYRLLTSAFVHGGLFHVAFNMMAFVPIGTSLERMQGTLALAHVIGLFIFVGGGAYVAFATAASYVPWRCRLCHQPACLHALLVSLCLLWSHSLSRTDWNSTGVKGALPCIPLLVNIACRPISVVCMPPTVYLTCFCDCISKQAL